MVMPRLEVAVFIIFTSNVPDVGTMASGGEEGDKGAESKGFQLFNFKM